MIRRGPVSAECDRSLHHQPMCRVGPGETKLLQTFQMQVEGLARVGERFCQCIAASNDGGNIWKIDDVGRFLRW